MDVVTMLRDLWRHRYALVGVLVLSGLAAIIVLYSFSPPFRVESRKYTVGVANTRVLIDTPSSQVAAIAPEGAGDFGMRADLLSRIMVAGTVKAKIAEAAGLHPNELFGVSQSGADDVATPPPPRDAPVLTTRVVMIDSGMQLPLIEIDTQGADAASAATIADAAVKGLRDYVDQQAADGRVPDQRRVRVTPLGQTQAESVVRGPKTVFAFIAAVFVFGLGCAAIVGLAAVVRAWGRANAPEQWPTEQWPTEQWLFDEDVVPLAKARTAAEEREQDAVAPVAVSPLRHAESDAPESQSVGRLAHGRRSAS